MRTTYRAHSSARQAAGAGGAGRRRASSILMHLNPLRDERLLRPDAGLGARDLRGRLPSTPTSTSVRSAAEAGAARPGRLVIALSAVRPDATPGPRARPCFATATSASGSSLIAVVALLALLPAVARRLPLHGRGPEHRAFSRTPGGAGRSSPQRSPCPATRGSRRRASPCAHADTVFRGSADRPARGAPAVPAQGQAVHVHAPARRPHRDHDDHAALPLRLAGQRPHRHGQRPRHRGGAARLPERPGALRRAPRPAPGRRHDRAGRPVAGRVLARAPRPRRRPARPPERVRAPAGRRAPPRATSSSASSSSSRPSWWQRSSTASWKTTAAASRAPSRSKLPAADETRLRVARRLIVAVIVFVGVMAALTRLPEVGTARPRPARLGRHHRSRSSASPRARCWPTSSRASSSPSPSRCASATTWPSTSWQGDGRGGAPDLLLHPRRRQQPHRDPQRAARQQGHPQLHDRRRGERGGRRLRRAGRRRARRRAPRGARGGRGLQPRPLPRPPARRSP